MHDAEKAVRRLVSSMDDQDHPQEPSHGATDHEAQQRRESVTQDAGSDDDDDGEDDDDDALSVDALEDQFLLLEEEVATLVADVRDLALYTKLNITGFMKILKVRLPDALPRCAEVDTQLYASRARPAETETRCTFLPLLS